MYYLFIFLPELAIWNSSSKVYHIFLFLLMDRINCYHNHYHPILYIFLFFFHFLRLFLILYLIILLRNSHLFLIRNYFWYIILGYYLNILIEHIYIILKAVICLESLLVIIQCFENFAIYMPKYFYVFQIIIWNIFILFFIYLRKQMWVT